MTETAIDRLGDLIAGALSLTPEAYQLIATLPLSSRTALAIVVAAGFSQSVAQGIVLFVNRVRPLRFGLSLVIAAILFVAGVVFWVLTTWVSARLLFGREASLEAIWRVLGLSYAPQLFSVFVALPYLGVPISIMLSVWSFLAFLTGLRVALNIELGQAFWCGVLGWVVFEVLQRTIGRPVAAIGRWLANTVAGVTLVTDLKQLERAAINFQRSMSDEELR